MTELTRETTRNGIRSMHWDWVPSIVFKPRQTIGRVLESEKPVWLTPLLLLSILALLVVVISAPVQRAVIQSGSKMPENFEYWTPEEQDRFFAAQANLTSPVFLYLLPALSRLAGYWLTWLLLSSLLHLVITLAGSRASRRKTSNLVAWTMVPFVVRLIIEILVVLFSKQLINVPGLSVLIPSESSKLGAFIRGILSSIDIYYVWHVLLLVLGTISLSGLMRGKAILSALIAEVVVLLLMAIPSLVSAMLSGISLTSAYFY